MKSPTWRIRSWSIRAKIITLLLPPLISMIVLWIFATSLSAGSALALLDTQTNFELAGKPAEALSVELQRERKLSLVYIASGRQQNRPEGKALADQRPKTDKAIAELRRLANSDRMQSIANHDTKHHLAEMFKGLDGLAGGRTGIDLGQIDRAGAMRLYTEPIDATYRMYMALPGIENTELSHINRTIIAMSRGRELLAQEDALLNGVVAAGRFARNEHLELIQAIGVQRFLYADASAELPAAAAEEFRAIQRGDAYTRLRAFEDRIIAEARPNVAAPVDITEWRSAYDKLFEDLRDLDIRTGAALTASAQPVGKAIFFRLGAAAILGLVAVAVSILLSIRIGRSLIRRLTGLRHDAQSLADERLPATVARLRRGEDVDVQAAAPPLEYGSDEIGEVGNAFGAVQRTAIESAVHEATLRRGLNEVFLNIARRSQTLLHRQLALLDRMERRSTDPEELEDLFRVDHLATRMRRHAEDLVILAGAAPGRGWRHPVPMLDVVRGAVSEVEDYARVGFGSLPEANLVGRAVADVIHLLAEVIENATSYSPPHTQVQISGQLVPNGFAIEIEDRGLGMSPEAIDEANRRLLQPPDFDPANSARLGLFVVALLAARHGIRVTLRASAYGGITAVVLVPPHLVSGASAEMTAATASERAQLDADQVLELRAADVVRPVMASATQVPKRRAALQPVAAAVAPPAAPVELTDDGLPRRQRQASLAPQLREPANDDPTNDDPTLGGVTSVADDQAHPRSPEQVREMMTSFQAGFIRGRRDAASTDDEAAATPSERDA